MPKMIASLDGGVIKELPLTKDRTTIGRRPYNDIVLDNLAVSGEHAVMQVSGSDVFLEDLNSTNGTYINGTPIKKQLLRHGDMVEIGKYKLHFVHEAASDPPQKPMANPSGLKTGNALIQVMSGATPGLEVPLIKVVTTIGKPGVAVAAITHRPQGYVLALVEGTVQPTLNGNPIGNEPVKLCHGDLIEIAGTQMQFMQP